MAVARAVCRLVAGAEVALAVSVLAACAGSTPAPQSAGAQPSAAASGSGSTSGPAASAPAGQPPPAPAGGQPNPAATRASLFGAFSTAGAGGDINLLGVPDGASCTATAHRKGRSEQLSITENQPEVAGRDSLQFTLTNPPDGATIEWSVTCTLSGETAARTAETSTQPSQGSTEPPSAPPTGAPSHAAPSPPAVPTPSASHS